MKSACIVSTLFLAACSSPDDAPGHTFRTFREGDISIAQNSGGPLYDSELFHFTPLVTLRGDDSVPESLLPRPGDFTSDENGQYYVIDSRDRKVAVFNSVGRYVRSFGRQGSGPGEFRLMRLQSLRDGVVSIFDSSQQRTTRIRTDGILLEVLKLTSGGRVSGLERTLEGTLIAKSTRAGSRENVALRSLAISHLTADGRDTLMTIVSGAVDYTANIYVGQIDGKRTEMVGPIPFSASVSTLYMPDRGILLTEGTDPELRWYDLSGNLTQVTRLGLTPQPVTDEMKREYAESVNMPYATVNPEWVFPEYAGLWNNAFMDDSGFIWLQAVAEAQRRGQRVGTVMQVVSPRGELLGVTELPCRFEGVSRGLLLGYQTDEETGEQIPSIFRISPMVRGLKYPN